MYFEIFFLIFQLLDFHPESNEICVTQGLFEWLMTRGTKKGAFDANKLYSSQLLSMLLQSTELARKKLTEKRDGIDLLLRVNLHFMVYLFFEILFLKGIGRL
jgi:beta-catenin-like protein 1